MGPLGVVLLEPRRNHDEGLVAAGKPVMPEALLFQRPEEALDHPVLLWRVRRDVLLVEPVAAHDAHKTFAPNTSPLSDRSVSGAWPYSIRRSRSASSSVAAAIRATPDRDSRQPTIVRSQQSMMAVRWHHPSCPQKTCVASTAQPPFGRVTRETQPRARGRWPRGRCRICQPLALRIRWIRLRLTAARSSRRTSTVSRRSP